MDKESEPSGIRRRGFLTAIGAGVAGASVAKAAPVQPPENAARLVLNVNINGQARHLTIEPQSTLLHVLRDRLGMTGTKVGCEHGECGMCTVLIDGIPRYACLFECIGKQLLPPTGKMLRPPTGGSKTNRRQKS